MVTAQEVQALRNKTNLPMMDCKRALVENNGNEEKSIVWLREQGLIRSTEFALREASEGIIASYSKENRCSIVKVCCETSPVASTKEFIALANLVAKQAWFYYNETPESLLSKQLIGDSSKKLFDEIHFVFNKVRENIRITECYAFDNSVAYIHHNKQIGSLVSFSGEINNSTKLDICMHIVAMKPKYINRNQVPKDIVDKERQFLVSQVIGKPANIIDKIVDGKLNKWFSEFVLLEQMFVKDDKKTIASVLEKSTIENFVLVSIND